MIFHDTTVSLKDTADGPVLSRSQEISDEFLERCREARFASSAPAGELHEVASVPTAVVELWLRQGFDIYREPAKAILSRLRAHGLDAFITTNKAL